MKPTKKMRRMAKKLSIRKKISGTAQRPRLSVFRSVKHIYAQLINDDLGVTLAAASTVDKEIRGQKMSGKVAAAKIGAMIAQRAKGKEIDKVTFDRSGYRYHGVIKSLADSARENGLLF